MSFIPRPKEHKDYENTGRTKQAFKDATDINKILKKAQKTGSISHLAKYDQAVYGDFQGYDLLEAHQMIDRANQIFGELPSEVRSEFGGDAIAFAQWASDPLNIDRLGELLPAIAEPGSYFPNPVKRGAKGAGAATAPEEAVEADIVADTGPEAPAAPAASEASPTPA